MVSGACGMKAQFCPAYGESIRGGHDRGRVSGSVERGHVTGRPSGRCDDGSTEQERHQSIWMIGPGRAKAQRTLHSGGGGEKVAAIVTGHVKARGNAHERAEQSLSYFRGIQCLPLYVWKDRISI